ncbi:LOW QUALITY PROTEIN: deoxyhypusine synthase [Pterocles gutturalis]
MAAPGPVPAGALRAVLRPSDALPPGSLPVRGYDFSGGPDHAALLRSFQTTGFQATSFAQAAAEIHRMIAAKLEPLSAEERARAALGGSRPPSGCTIFLGFTSNLISSGVRETIRYLVQRDMVDVLVTTAGGVEEDLIKLAPTYIGDFSLRGQDLRRSGINRIGNPVPNDNYCRFEDWLMPILERMVDEQETQGVRWTPSRMMRLGKEIDNPESVCYWAQRVGGDGGRSLGVTRVSLGVSPSLVTHHRVPSHEHIPVLSPALTDGSLGDMIFLHSYKRPGLVLDIWRVSDLRLINTPIFARKTGMSHPGRGLVKHHIANANLMRNGADFSVYVNTGQEFDGSDSGARQDEAVSWGRSVRMPPPVKVYADASLVFPLLVAETFAQRADAFPVGTPGGLSRQALQPRMPAHAEQDESGAMPPLGARGDLGPPTARPPLVCVCPPPVTVCLSCVPLSHVCLSSLSPPYPLYLFWPLGLRAAPHAPQ